MKKIKQESIRQIAVMDKSKKRQLVEKIFENETTIASKAKTRIDEARLVN